MPVESQFLWPYTPGPGGATPRAGETPEAGRREIRTFVYLSLVSSAIIIGAGIAAYVAIH